MCPRATASSYRTLRADAERNRLKILDAARSVFAERGLDASLDEIADRAGVGIATRYGRFPPARTWFRRPSRPSSPTLPFPCY
jgi:AcrR family transcriptional regulator